MGAIMKYLPFKISLHGPDIVWENFRCGGKGGQAVNKKNTGIRVRHVPSGAVGEGREFSLKRTK